MSNHLNTHLIKKLQMITLKLKSFAFMKIFMSENSSPSKENKVRHYDLELEGASAISGWLKNKLQQVYLRSFVRLKEFRKATKPKYPATQFQAQSQPYISAVNSPSNSPSKQVESRTRCQTDRDLYVKGKPSEAAKNGRKNNRSEYGQQTQQSLNSRKSNLQNLLHKIRQVNTQSKIDKENEYYKANYEDFEDGSCGGSRVLSTHTGIMRRFNNRPVQGKQVGFKHQAHMTHAGFYPGERHQSSYIQYNQPGERYMQEFQTPNSQVQKIISRLDLEEDCVLDKNNLLSLKKWHKNQKRSVIMNKIKELQNSLLAEYSREEEMGYGEYEEESIYPVTSYGNTYDQTFGHNHNQYNYEPYYMPNNYSEAYLQQRARQAPRTMYEVPRTVYEVKMRKY